jgi:hypothetical protein
MQIKITQSFVCPGYAPFAVGEQLDIDDLAVAQAFVNSGLAVPVESKREKAVRAKRETAVRE